MSRRRRLGRVSAESSVLRLAMLVVALWTVFTFTVEGFWSAPGLGTVLGRSVTDGLLVVGLTLCLLGGQIDLSIGSVLALSGVVFSLVQPEYGLVAGAAAGIASGLAIGAANAVLVTVLRLNSFIATLGTLLAARALALVAAEGGPVAGTNLGAALRMNELVVGPLSLRVLILFLVLVPAWGFLAFTRVGREIVAIGGDSPAAEAAGVPVRRRLSLAFVLSGGIAGLAGVQQAISLLSASPVVGDTNLLTAAAGAFLGGIALTGGRGNVLAAVLGVVALASIATGLEFALLQSAYQQIVIGAMIITMGLFTGRGGPSRSRQLARRRKMRRVATATSELS